MAAHKIAACLGEEKSRALPIFHALTGCDISTAFVGHGKKSAWIAWNSLPELTDALLRLACVPTEIPKHSMQAIENFFTLMYDRTSTCIEVNEARKKLFGKKFLLQRIPPTCAALEQHVKGAVFHAGWSYLVSEHLSHSLCFLLQVDGGGSRPAMDYMNHIGPHYQKHPRPAMSWSHVAA